METAAVATPTTIQEGEVGVVLSLKVGDAVVDVDNENTLPRYVIFQSGQNHRYLHHYSEDPVLPNALRYTGDYSFDLDTRFELVPATTGTGLIHIRSLQNNKYWVKIAGQNRFVSAMADKPEENQFDEFCTLFEPVFLDSIRLRHVSTGYYARYFQYPGTPYDGYLYLSDTYNDDDDVCYFIDWEDVVVLPDLIRIKGDNGNHVRTYEDGHMDFLNKADNSSMFEYEVFPSRDGGIRLKSIQFGTYWTDMDDSDWVHLQQPDDPTDHATNTVFLLTILDESRIILRCLGNNLFCKRYDNNIMLSGLATLNDYPDKWSSLEIEEPVISRKIYNVIYHLTDARFYNETTDSLIDDDSSNKSPDPVTSQLNLKKTVKNTTNWSTSASLTLGVKMSLTFGVPFIESGSLEVSAEGTKSSDWGGTVEESLEVGSVKTISVPPMSRIKGTLMATRMSYDIPFSYTQRDVLKNGDKKTTVKHDGIFTGNNGYGYRFEIVPLPFSDGEGED